MSEAIYRVLLRLCPAELRRWEAEMVEVFAQQLADARGEGGWLGALDVWRCALVEILGMGVTRGALAIPIVSLASTGVIFVALMWTLENSLALLHAYRHWVDKLGG